MKHRILVDLGEYIDNITASQRHELAAFFNDEEGKERIVNVLDDNMFKSYFEYFFYNYSMLSVKELNSQEVVAAFNNMWEIFQHEESENLNKLAQGYFWKYNPIYNYDRTEDTVDVKTGSETDEGSNTYGYKEEKNVTSGSYKDTNQPSGTYRDTTVNGESVRTDKVSTMDTNVFQNKEQSSVASVTNYNERTYNQYKEENTRTYTNLQDKRTEEEHEDLHGNEHTYNEVTNTHHGKMTGNVGTTTTWDMLIQEFENRVHEFGYEFLKRFFDKYFVML